MVLLLLHIFLQIILEMVPVSSSSSILLLLGQQSSESVQLLLHSFTIMIIGLYFFKLWWRYLRDFLTLKKEGLVLGCAVISADLVTTGFYFFWKWVGVDWLPLWCGLVVTGLLLVSLLWIPLHISSCSGQAPRHNSSCSGQAPRHNSSCSGQAPRYTLLRLQLRRILGANGLCKFFNLLISSFVPNLMRYDYVSNRIERSGRAGHSSRVFTKGECIEGLILGFIQGIALLPGISRLGSTYVIARWLGYSPEKAFEYSWLIAWPLLVAGSAKGWWQVYKTGELVQLLNWPVMLAMLTAAVVSWYVLCWFAQLVKKEKVAYFAWWVFATAVFAFLVR